MCYLTARLCRLISFISKLIAAEHSSSGIFSPKSSDILIQPEISIIHACLTQKIFLSQL